MAFPALTTTVANTMIVHAFATGQDINTAQSSGAGTNAALTGLTNRMNNWSNAGSGGGFAMITGAKATAGAVGSTTTTVTTANVKVLFTGALKESTGTAVSLTDAGTGTDALTVAAALTLADPRSAVDALAAAATATVADSGAGVDALRWTQPRTVDPYSYVAGGAGNGPMY